MKAAPVADYLQSRHIAFALIGGFAVIARGRIRYTEDYDFLTTDRSVLERGFWGDLQGVLDVRRGDLDDPLGGVVHIRLPNGADVDVVVGKHRWEEAIIARAELVDFGGVLVPVPLTDDLILLKLSAGGPVDQFDIHELLYAHPDRAEIVAQVDAHIGDLPHDAQQLWAKLRAE